MNHLDPCTSNDVHRTVDSLGRPVAKWHMQVGHGSAHLHEACRFRQVRLWPGSDEALKLMCADPAKLQQSAMSSALVSFFIGAEPPRHDRFLG